LSTAAAYSYPTYLNCITTLIARLNVTSVYWVGTSMGGLIGMWLSSLPHTFIQKLIINDIGPFVPKTGLDRLGHYVGKEPHQNTLQDMADYLKVIYEGFGQLPNDLWLSMAEHSTVKTEDGKYKMSYDPAIAHIFGGEMKDLSVWPLWDAISVPKVSVLRGKVSDILLKETLEEMNTRGPKLTHYAELDSIGHAPSLMLKEQIELIAEWLEN